MSKKLNDLTFTEPTKLDFIKRLTTPTGMIQHTKFAVPDRIEGYSTDDNARALLLVVKDFSLFGKHQALNFALTYLSYLSFSKTTDNWFYTYMSFDHTFRPETSQDAFGRVVWALGVATQKNVRWDITAGAQGLFNSITPNLTKLTFHRAQAYSLLGCLAFQDSGAKNDVVEKAIRFYTKNLSDLYEANASAPWPWFEDRLTYSNGLLPLSLFKAYEYLKEDHLLRVAVESLGFLESQSVIDGKPAPIGTEGWFLKGGKRALFDQQPVDPAMMVMANVAAYKVLGEASYKARALEWFRWFHGNNLKGVSIYDEQSGGCFDGLSDSGVNLNQGAESAVIYWLAYLDLVEMLKK